jgi:sugar phosphate isomerase/epimerase
MTQIPIALQLYTVRESTTQDLVGTFSKLSDIGYKYVELAGLYGKTSAELKTILADADLKAISAHVGLPEFDSDKIGETIKTYQDLGVDTVVVPYVGEDIRHAGAGYKGLADKLNSTGELLSKYGITIGYHNHGFEIEETVDGKPAIEYLIENTDPSMVTFELDSGWVVNVNHDPIAFIKKHATRLSLIHIKDLEADKSWAPIGTGILPLEGVIGAAVAANVRYLIVEQDTTKGPELDAVKTSLENLKTKGYA